tara:strand:- start:69 stop:1052 length:984 start_codon:yes stop_codon:yes gene_type:complete
MIIKMPGVFDVTIKENKVYKKVNKNHSIGKNLINQLKNPTNRNRYIKALNSDKLDIIGEFIAPPLEIYDNGDYNMKEINGVNLMDILPRNNHLCKMANWKSKQLTLDKTLCKSILEQLIVLETSLYRYNKITTLSGDWFLHNLIYDFSMNKIYNIDLEGFYTYKGKSDMSDLTYFIPEQFGTCKKYLLQQMKISIFSVILWNPVEKYYQEIQDLIEKNFPIILNTEHTVKNMKTFVDRVYELDVRCHKPYLPKKIDILNTYKPKVKFFLILIDQPKYDRQNVSHTAIKLKEEIRSIYKPKLENYYKDIIVHISDNQVEAGNIYRLML